MCILLSSIVIKHVAVSVLDQILIENGINSLERKLHLDYEKRLIDIIRQTIREFKSQNNFSIPWNKVAFYDSEILFEELNKYLLFDNKDLSIESISQALNKNKNIIPPSKSDLDAFYQKFIKNIKSDNKLQKLFIEENYKIKIFDIDSRLTYLTQSIDNLIPLLQDIFNNIVFIPSRKWFIENNDSTINNLGKRYTPELNIELNISKLFEALGRTERFNELFLEKADSFLIAANSVIEILPKIDYSDLDLNLLLSKFKEKLCDDKYSPSEKIPIQELNVSIDEIEKYFNSIYDLCNKKIQNVEKENQLKRDYEFVISDITDLKYEISNLKEFFCSNFCKLANNPFLLVYGKAGIGKSHLIGDIISKRKKKNYASIFLLGSDFTTEDDPWLQILKKLQIQCSTETFLNQLENYAKKENKRLIIFIDALNEGKGLYFWGTYLLDFISKIRRSKWLGLVLTIRTSYKKIIFPENNNFNLIEIRHKGFQSKEYEAIKLFFKNYDIELPAMPILNFEFSNPLFLKLFCEGLSNTGKTRISPGVKGVTEIFNSFIENVNQKLSDIHEFNYSSESINLVEKTLNQIIEYQIQEETKYIPYEKAVEIIQASVKSFIHNDNDFTEALIREGLLSKNIIWKKDNVSEQVIYFTYQRLNDHLTAKYLLEQSTNLRIDFHNDGYLFPYIKDKQSLAFNKGLLEAFSIQIPEKNHQEFFSLIPELKNEDIIVESFIESLIWRDLKSFNQKSKEYAKEYAFGYRSFWETLISIAGIPNNFFNALYLFEFLIKYDLPSRDSFWADILDSMDYDDSTVMRMIEWATEKDNKSYISDESIFLSSITLTWFLASTNRKIRDRSTKALVCLLQDKLDILLEILIKFEGVNDLYISERLYAVTYGCVLRTDDKKSIRKISEFIYQSFFNKSEQIFPHLLLRDYARNIIEYANYIDNNLTFDVSKIRPPYNSVWPEYIPTFNELDKKYNNEDYHILWFAIMGSLSDFSRYTIGTNYQISDWTGYKRDEFSDNRKKIFLEFKKKLKPEQFALLENCSRIKTEPYGEEIKISEELTIILSTGIGEISAEEVCENKIKFKQSLLSSGLLEEYEKNIEPFLDDENEIKDNKYFDTSIAQRLIFSEVINLGWNPKLHGDFDKRIGTGRSRLFKYRERIGKKYQWIAYYKYMALLADNYMLLDVNDKTEKEYEGPWEVNRRDIDPTFLINYENSVVQDPWCFSEPDFKWNLSNGEWIDDVTDIPSSENIIQVCDEKNDEWLILNSYFEYSQPKQIGQRRWKQPLKNIWTQIESFLVHDTEFDLLKKSLSEDKNLINYMPEIATYSEIFSREFYWSPAQKTMMNEFYDGLEWVSINNPQTEEYLAKVNRTAQEFSWESSHDYSNEKQPIKFLLPSKIIYEGMGLKYSTKEFYFFDKFNQMQCFCHHIDSKFSSLLVIKKSSLFDFLRKNNLKVIWTVQTVKQISGKNESDSTDYKPMERYNTLYFNENNLINIDLS